MFGYIRPRFDQLSEEQKSRYRNIYCGVCQNLQELSGHHGRLALSHDMTFLAMLLNSLEEPAEQIKEYHCPVHLLKKQPGIHNQPVSYAAAMNLLLMYYKLEDRRIDHEFRFGSVEKKMFDAGLGAVRERYPRQFNQVDVALKEIWEEEKRSSPDPDKLTNLSGAMLGAVFVPDEQSFWAGPLRGLGDRLGRFVYWMDAREDLASDRKHGRYNPLMNDPDPSEMTSFAEAVMEMFAGEAATYFEALPLEKDLDLMRNVLYSGIWQRYYALQIRGGKEKQK